MTDLSKTHLSFSESGSPRSIRKFGLTRSVEVGPFSYRREPLEYIQKLKSSVETPLRVRKIQLNPSTASPVMRRVKTSTKFKPVLSTKGLQSRLAPNSRNTFEAWKISQSYPPKSKVFLIIGYYPALREALLKRNWVEGTEAESMYFDLKWTTKARIPVGIKDWQMINHFERNTEICTKIGLTENLEKLRAICRVNHSTFYPRTFKIQNVLKEDFLEMFKGNFAVSLLKKFQNFPDTVEPEKVHIALLAAKRLLSRFKKQTQFEKSAIIVSMLEWKLLEANSKSEIEAIYKKIRRNSSLVNFNGLISEVMSVLSSLEKSDCEFFLNGESNLWIVKPARKSRGREIAVYSELQDIRSHTHNSQPWVVQKYIENPLIIHNKKFDIRQWVLITQAEPLTVYIYQDSYLRFSVENFDLKSKDLFIHLTNNSIAKKSSLFSSSEIEGCMWNIQEFKNYLLEIHGYDVWEEKLFKEIKKIIKWTLLSIGRLGLRKSNSFELFGYDFMVDENLKPWLLEVNSSPSMESSTPVTTELVRNVLEDTVKVIIDAAEDPEADIGRFELCYKAKPRLH